ncbi:MAG TPA: tripartite tricarboxylate transporter permease [Streptosporangiaceae bacterium]|nr:tripartite tricarboxylate transporter permease [Streptosporangiaceae bacterium]
MTHDLLTGLSQLLSPEAIGLLVAGMAVGMFMGMLPGMGVSLALSLMLPFLYHMSVVPAIALMLGTQAASYYAASITAILLNTPGAPESFPVTLDGFPMAQRGQAGRALAISASSTWAGGWIGCAILIGLLQVAGQLIGLFHPPEFVAIIILALVLIGGTGESTSSSKVILSGAIGLMISFIGSDPVTGIDRFTFGSASLFDGINVVPFALGVFAMTQMVVMFSRNESVSGAREAMRRGHFGRQVGEGLRDAAANWIHVVRSAVVAALLGLIPGIGGFSANFISYSLGRQVSRKGSKFGTGVPAGVASAEGSSLSKEVGSLVPAVALGLPSGVGMVIFIAALTILGVQPGPTLLKSQPALPYSMMWVMAIAGLVSCALGLLLTPWLSRVTSVRGPVLMPFIVALSVLGSFAAVTGFAGVVELAVFAVIGVVMRKLGYSLAAMTIGLVLGGTFADNVHLTQTIYGWGFLARSPLADVFLAISALLLVLITLRNRRHSGVVVTPERAGRGPRRPHPVLEPVTDAVIVALSAAYLTIALGYPAGAGRLPAIVAAVAALVALTRLVTWASSTLITARRPVASELGDSALAMADSAAAVPVSGPSALQASSGPAGTERAGTAPAGAEPAGTGPAGSPATAGGPAASRAGGGPAESRRDGRRLPARARRELAAFGWIWAAVVAAYLFGFEIGVPAVAAAYCLTSVEWRRRWQKLSFAAAATGTAFVIALGFTSLFHLTFSGLLV